MCLGAWRAIPACRVLIEWTGCKVGPGWHWQWVQCNANPNCRSAGVPLWTSARAGASCCKHQQRGEQQEPAGCTPPPYQQPLRQPTAAHLLSRAGAPQPQHVAAPLAAQQSVQWRMGAAAGGGHKDVRARQCSARIDRVWQVVCAAICRGFSTCSASGSAIQLDTTTSTLARPQQPEPASWAASQRIPNACTRKHWTLATMSAIWQWGDTRGLADSACLQTFRQISATAAWSRSGQ